jgi:hypothetical protein
MAAGAGGFGGPLIKFMMDNPHISWANIEEIDAANFEKFGFEEALRRARARSERLASSGMSPKMSRKNRQEHYRRKAKLEERKELARRAEWEYNFPGAPESNWLRREERRKTRKQAERNLRRARRRSGSNKH